MITPRIEIDLSKIRHNTRCLVNRLKSRRIDLTGVTKAVCGHPAVAQAMLDGGAVGLAEARISNVQRLRQSGITCPITMIRTPMLSQVDQIIRSCETSFNSEITTILALAEAARRAGKTHNIVLIVEMGDMREGIMPSDLAEFAMRVVELDGIELKGIAANFACLNPIRPDRDQMRSFSELATEAEMICGPYMISVSGGNSSTLPWALGAGSTGRINDLRVGEAILLGRDPISGQQIGGLYTDAFTLVTEVIETKNKRQSIPVALVHPVLKSLSIDPENVGHVRSIIALGRQDTDIAGLSFPAGVTCLGSTSDHMVVQSSVSQLRIGSELRLGMNYSAIMRIMAAPDTTTVFAPDVELQGPGTKRKNGPSLEVV